MHSRRQDILNQAVLLMKQKGYAGTTIRDLANHFGFSKTNFYYHIKDKEEMLYQISFQTLTITTEKLRTILQADVAYPRRMHAILDCFVNLIANHHALIGVYFEERRHLRPAHIREMTRLEREIVQSIGTYYREGVSAGYFRNFDPAIAAWATLGTCLWMTKWYKPGGRLSHEVISQQLNTLVSEGYSSPPANLRRNPTASRRRRGSKSSSTSSMPLTTSG